MARLRIAHLSDLHARAVTPGLAKTPRRRSRLMPALLERLLAGLRREKVDLVAVTGDLVDAPLALIHPNDYYHLPGFDWAGAVAEDGLALRRILDHSGLAWTAVPGNHDHLPSWRLAFGEGSGVIDGPGGTRLACFADREWAMHVPRRLDRERHLFDQVLSGDDPRPQIHLQHFLIHPRRDEGYPHTYYEADELRRRLLADERVALVLCGHYHRGVEPFRDGRAWWSCVSAFCDFPHRYRIFDLCDGAVTAHEERALLDRPVEAGRPVVFLDRDGVITREGVWLEGPERLALVPGAAAAIRDLRTAGFAVVVVTNQTAVGRGYLTSDLVAATHDHLCALLAAEAGPEAQPDLILCSTGCSRVPVHPDLADDQDAKPSPVLLERAVALLALDRTRAWMVGDRTSDLEAGARFGCPGILVRTGLGGEAVAKVAARGAPAPLAVVDDLSAAAALIRARR